MNLFNNKNSSELLALSFYPETSRRQFENVDIENVDFENVDI